MMPARLNFGMVTPYLIEQYKQPNEAPNGLLKPLGSSW